MSTPTVTSGLPLRLRGLTKTYGDVRAVDAVDADIEPGRVTGLLGPNGSGKTTIMRMLLGLARPTHGTATIGGRHFSDFPQPARVVGASLEANFHPGRTGRAHLRTLAPAVGASDRRIDETLDLVGLTAAADRKIGGYSLGMRQRIGLASTLLGDPQVLVLDEPANGLDPQGVAWLRDFLRHLAGEGRTVLVSSHFLGEVQATVDDVIVLSQGRLVHASSLTQMTALVRSHVLVDGPDRAGIAAALGTIGGAVSQVTTARGQRLQVDDADAASVGALLHRAGLEIHALEEVGADLETTFLRIVSGEVPGIIRELHTETETEAMNR